MKLLIFFIFTTVLAKSNRYLLENLNSITSKLEFFASDLIVKYVNQDLTNAIAEFTSNTKSAIKEDIEINQLKELTAQASNLNLNAMISSIIGEEKISVKKTGSAGGANKWSEYGCFCTAHHAKMKEGNWVGKGEPVDRIDYLCRQLWWGYKCLSRDFTGCSSEIAYNWFLVDQELQCIDNKGTCAGDLCRLELQFATELGQIANSWDKKNHLSNGFDRNASCTSKAPKKPSVNTRIGLERSGSSTVTFKEGAKTTILSECCGQGILRTIYKPDRQQCCNDGSVRPLGYC